MNRTPEKLRRQLLLAGSALFAVSAAWAQTAPAPTETKAATPAKTGEAPVETAAKPEAADLQDDVVVMSPFVVSGEKDQGYYAENTLAGSRMNTNLADLAPSISVVTKQQLEDTASIDINDVFRYEINTEGSLTYTPYVQSLRSDGVTDLNAGTSVAGGVVQTNATANRVRGLGVPSSALNYFPAISQIPMDAYNVEMLEISRGPNSMLFGMGSPAGIVNQTTAKAALNRRTTRLTLRLDNYGSNRAALNFNLPLFEDKLALYGALLYEDRSFARKPSYDKTRRQYGALTYKPFAKTTFRANFERFTNDNRRPNSITPRDFVTEWRSAGMPVYDPNNKLITKLGTGQVIGPYILDTASPYANNVRAYIESRPNFNPALWNAAKTTYNGVTIFGEAALTTTTSTLYVPGITWTNQARTIRRIANGQLVDWFQPLGNQQYRTAWGTATNPTANADLFPTKANIWANPVWSDIHNRYFTSSNAWSQTGSNVGNYKYPGVTSKSVYDYTELNVNQMNYGRDSNNNFNFELEQQLTSDLYLNAAWFRQDFNSLSNYVVGQLNVATLNVDTNLALPNGSPNPYFGKVYVEDIDPDMADSAEQHEHSRVMLAYTPDFTRKDGWMKWLGRHQILGLWSKQNSMVSYIRKRLNYVGAGSDAGKFRYFNNQNNNADGTPTGWNYQSTSLRHMYYLAGPTDPSGAAVRSSGPWNAGRYTGNIQVYNYATSAFENISMTTDYIDRSETTGRNARQIESLSAGMTNYLWRDRLITTLGIRSDDYRARSTTTGAINRQGLSKGDPTADKNLAGVVVPAGQPVPIAPAMTNQQMWVNGVFQTQTVFNRWNRWDELSGKTKTVGGVFKPFKNWQSIESRADAGSFIAEFLRDFGVSYNKSDNFNAPATAQVDAFGAPLPKPTGTGEDYGIQFSVFDGKLFTRLTWFKASNENERMNAGTAISRLTGNLDTNLFRVWARTIAMINMGMDPTSATFGQNLSANDEAAVQAAAATIWQQSYTYYTDVGSIGATRNAEAKGVELQINYNPTRNWTMKLTAGKQDTKYSKVLTEFTAWYNHRKPVWDNAKAATYLLPQYQNRATYTTSGGRPVDLTNFWTSYGYADEARLDDAFGNTNVQRYYDNVVAPQATLARDLDGQSAPGQRKNRFSFLTNYVFENDRLKGWSVGGSQRWEDKAVIGYLGKSSGANLTNPLFMDVSDVTKPVYDSDNWYTDLWVSYSRKVFNGKVGMKIQLNVNDVFENGGLKATAVNYDGSPYSFRIVDPRTYVLTTTFDF